VVAERCRHERIDHVATTRTYFEMERLLRREYYGRFLIELLQNARDAWLGGERRRDELGVVTASLVPGPTLMVANSGKALDVDAVLMSLGEFGQSTKPKGEAIGHKGIGFKSVLELTRRPEIFSRSPGETAFKTAVRFDPDAALERIRAATPNWDAWVHERATDGTAQPPVPALRFPTWCEEIPTDVPVDDPAVQTVIRLPFASGGLGSAGIDAETFIEKVRQAFRELTDEMFVLLGCFSELRIEDDIGGTETVFRLKTIDSSRTADTERKQVAIFRNDVETARFLMYERSLPGFEKLEGDICVAIRITKAETGHLSLDPDVPESGPPFHLFFPTQIPSGLPLLLHAYFEVGASREQFAADSKERNDRLLLGLHDLAVDAIADIGAMSQAGHLDVSLLPELFGRTAIELPAISQAHVFRTTLLDSLDDVKWVSVRSSDPAGLLAAPREVLLSSSWRTRDLAQSAFTPEYVYRRLRRWYPAPNIDETGYGFLASRRCALRLSQPETLKTLFVPGGDVLWSEEQDAGFKALLRLVQILKSTDPTAIAPVMAVLPGNDDARIIPVLDTCGGRRFIPVPDAVDESRRKDVAIFARLKRAAAGDAPPPQFLDTAFVADELLDSDLLSGPAREFGIRDFNTDGVLDRLSRFVSSEDAGEAALSDAQQRMLTAFVWRLLLRQIESAYSVRDALNSMQGNFDPGAFFFCKPRRARTEASGAADQRRERTLSGVRLPTRAGSWRPACELVFGADWADWLEGTPQSSVEAERARAYRDLETLAPDDSNLVGSPGQLRELLPLDKRDVSWLEKADSQDSGSKDQHLELLHAFLLRLGVWEVPPIVAVVNYKERRTDRDPFIKRADRAVHWTRLSREGGFAFGRDKPHQNLHVGEDYDFSWSFPFAGRSASNSLNATADAAAVQAISRGAVFYSRYESVVLFCPDCQRHRTRYYNDGEAYDSLLAHRLRQQRWLPATIDGRPAGLRLPQECFVESNLPREDRFRQSHLRFVPLAPRDFSAGMADLCCIGALANATLEQVVALLERMRDDFDGNRLLPDPRRDPSARHPFVRLHRQLYDRLSELVDDDVALQVWSARLGVLCDIGGRLEWRSPPTARFDNGDFASWKRHFQGRVPFSVIEPGKERTARRLGIQAFKVQFQASHGDVEVDVTDSVRCLVRDRIPALLALLVYYRSGGPPLQLGSIEFGERSRRLAALRVVRTCSLEVHAFVTGLGLDAQVTDGSVYLDRTTANKPVLYVDAVDSDILSVLRSRLAAALSTVVENGAIQDTFALFLQSDEADYIESFLQERGIRAQELEEVRRSANVADAETAAVEARWWRGLSDLLGFAGSAHTRARLLELLGEAEIAPPLALVESISACEGDISARRDASESSVLFQLETHGHSITTFDSILRQLGDDGIALSVGADKLHAFRAQHGPAIAFLLALSGIEDGSAKAIVQKIQARESVSLLAQPAPSEWLAPVLEALAVAKLKADPDLLAGSEANAHLASLAGLTEAELMDGAQALYSEEERRRQSREAALAWRRELIPVLIASRCIFTDPDYRIRELAQETEAALPDDVAEPHWLSAALGSYDAVPESVRAAIQRIIPATQEARRPDRTKIVAAVEGQFSDPGIIDRVRSVLARGPRKKVDELRRRMSELAERAMEPKAYAGSRATPTKQRSRPARKRVPIVKVKDSQRHRDRLGADAEEWVVASSVRAFLTLPEEQRKTAIEAAKAAVNAQYEGEGADRIVKFADEALAAPNDSDEFVDSLSNFVHLSAVSDSFGCDVLGYLAPYAGQEPRPLFLEVKSDSDRSFPASDHEWVQAGRIGEDFAFLVVLRGKDGFPRGMELLPDPHELLTTDRIALEPESWTVRYGIAAGKGEENPSERNAD